MDKLAVIMLAGLLLASTGCGSTSQAPFVTYTSRAGSDNYSPHLYILDPTTRKSSAVGIPIPQNAAFVTFNRGATAVTYCYNGSNGLFDIFFMGTDGKEKQLTTNAFAVEPVFSPDGKTIAYVSIPGPNFVGVFTMNEDGSNQKPVYLPAANTGAPYFPEFSPDGKSLVFYVQVSTPGPQPGAPSASGWYRMALTDTLPTLVYATDTYWGPAVYSADGTKLLLTLYDGTRYNISSVNLDGTGLTALTSSTNADNFSPVPFKGQILFNRWNKANSTWDIYAMDQAGTNQAQVVSSTTNTLLYLIDAYFP
jgi:Tol biopolymer transport system component